LTFDAQKLLDESTLQLDTLGWTYGTDEANFPRFQLDLAGKSVSFCYQAIAQDDKTVLLFIAQVTQPEFCAAFGTVADTKFNDIGIANKAFRVVCQNPCATDVVALVQTIAEWAESVDAPAEINSLAEHKPTKTHENLKHLTALGLGGHRSQLESYLEMAKNDVSQFGKAGPKQIEAALIVANASHPQNGQF